MKKRVIGLNGVDLKRLSDTLAAVKEQPSLGRFQFRLSNKWINGGQNESVIKGFYAAGKEDNTRSAGFVYSNDEPEMLFGNNSAPRPAEYALHALAGCLTTSLVYHAAARGYKITKVNSTLEGDIDLRGFLGLPGAARNGYKEIRVKFDIEGDFPEEKKEEILKLGLAFSPVYDMITNGVSVKIDLAVATAKVEAEAN